MTALPGWDAAAAPRRPARGGPGPPPEAPRHNEPIDGDLVFVNEDWVWSMREKANAPAAACRTIPLT
ncbi:hypothetical protein [Streptomyces griseoluteus]|uniref:hypothetical protein n=1 Tax=Streptomyces griseoluteus TaxID=29306 RepID=UPI0036FAACAB